MSSIFSSRIARQRWTDIIISVKQEAQHGEKRRIEVNIGGYVYKLMGEESEEHMQQVAMYIDEEDPAGSKDDIRPEP
ncbi:MAG: cell division protein ZapA [Clostridia bacterium]